MPTRNHVVGKTFEKTVPRGSTDSLENDLQAERAVAHLMEGWTDFFSGAQDLKTIEDEGRRRLQERGVVCTKKVWSAFEDALIEQFRRFAKEHALPFLERGVKADLLEKGRTDARWPCFTRFDFDLLENAKSAIREQGVETLMPGCGCGEAAAKARQAQSFGNALEEAAERAATAEPDDPEAAFSLQGYPQITVQRAVCEVLAEQTDEFSIAVKRWAYTDRRFLQVLSGDPDHREKQRSARRR